MACTETCAAENFPCPAKHDCNASFKSKSKLSQHVKRIHPSYVKCTQKDCDAFVQSRVLYRHIKIVHDKVKEICQNCQKPINFSYMKLHLERCTGEKTKRCMVERCGASFVAETLLNDHIRNSHTASIKCPREGCNTFVKPRNLVHHIRGVHEKIRPKICKRCKKLTANLEKHTCPGDATRTVSCTMSGCKSSFFTKRQLQLHIRQAHAALLKCPLELCGQYLKPRSFGRHVKVVHKQQLDKCPNCGKFLVSLYHHLKICNAGSERKFECPAKGCKSSFTSKIYLNRHKYAVHKEPVRCPEVGCDARVKPTHLTDHMRAVHAPTRKTCKKCGKEVRYLKRHLAICAPEKESSTSGSESQSDDDNDDSSGNSL